MKTKKLFQQQLLVLRNGRISQEIHRLKKLLSGHRGIADHGCLERKPTLTHKTS
jgi:hypothetical protein